MRFAFEQWREINSKRGSGGGFIENFEIDNEIKF